MSEDIRNQVPVRQAGCGCLAAMHAMVGLAVTFYGLTRLIIHALTAPASDSRLEAKNFNAEWGITLSGLALFVVASALYLALHWAGRYWTRESLSHGNKPPSSR